LKLQNTFAELGDDFYQKKSPDPVTAPYLIHFNPSVSKLIDLTISPESEPEFTSIFSGNHPLPQAFPLAMVYSGHQFGVYNPRLGDGRGLLLSEAHATDGSVWDIYLKGCGPTRFARGFDGRATLRSSIREYLAGEAMHALGIPSTRAIALIGIRDLIFRDRPELAAVLVRFSDSHIRFGSFEQPHYSNHPEKIPKLLDYAIQRHFPDINDSADKYRLFFREVVQRTAVLIAHWQTVGFVHGVMNTDNMLITGATFDYGPFGFLDRFNPGFTANSSDTSGRYAWSKQPEIGHWNLSKLGETLVSICGASALEAELNEYQPIYNQTFRALMGKKLGLDLLDEEFSNLVGRLFQILSENPVDFTNFFRGLSNFPEGRCESLYKYFPDKKVLDDWLSLYRRLLDREDQDNDLRARKMNRANPKFILRNHLLEHAISKAMKESDHTEINRLFAFAQSPFDERPECLAKEDFDPQFYYADTPQKFIDWRLSCSA
jgi:serine/tyrosine/threonine adenylyltransferase